MEDVHPPIMAYFGWSLFSAESDNKLLRACVTTATIMGDCSDNNDDDDNDNYENDDDDDQYDSDDDNDYDDDKCSNCEIVIV